LGTGKKSDLISQGIHKISFNVNYAPREFIPSTHRNCPQRGKKWRLESWALNWPPAKKIIHKFWQDSSATRLAAPDIPREFKALASKTFRKNLQ
jgi:hypothetical protein